MKTTMEITLPKTILTESPEGEYGWLEETLHDITGDDEIQVSHVGYHSQGGGAICVIYKGKKPGRIALRDLLLNDLNVDIRDVGN
jgi:hypothetical protein